MTRISTGRKSLFFLLACACAIWVHGSKIALAQEPLQSALASMQQKLSETRLQIEFLNIKKKDTRLHVKSLEKRIQKQEKKLVSFRAQLEEVASESIRVRSKVALLQNEVVETRSKSVEILKRFRGRLVHLHKIRQGTLLSSIFSAKDLNSFSFRFEMVRYLLQNDRQILASIKENRQALRDQISQLTSTQVQLKELEKLTAKKREDLQLTMSSLTAMLKTLIFERKLFDKRQKSLTQSQTSLERQISLLEAQRQKNPKSIESMLTTVSKPLVDPKGTAQQKPPAKLSVGGMSFSWPIRRIGKSNFLPSLPSAPPSLEIIVDKKTEILAAEKGKVLFKGPLGQFGNVIILGHRKGFSSIYARLDDMWTGLGQVVERGETIGRILGTANMRLHFEIRFGGKNQDPLKFLPPLK